MFGINKTDQIIKTYHSWTFDKDKPESFRFQNHLLKKTVLVLELFDSSQVPSVVAPGPRLVSTVPTLEPRGGSFPPGTLLHFRKYCCHGLEPRSFQTSTHSVSTFLKLLHFWGSEVAVVGGGVRRAASCHSSTQSQPSTAFHLRLGVLKKRRWVTATLGEAAFICGWVPLSPPLRSVFTGDGVCRGVSKTDVQTGTLTVV